MKKSSSTVRTVCGSPFLGTVHVVDEDKLSAVLSEFARTVITDFPIQGILDHLVGRIVGVLPVTAAGVTLISNGRSPHYIAASDASALEFERLQTEIGQGPCLAAFSTGEAVAVADLATDTRFPLFSPAAAQVGLAAVFTFPLRHGAERLGALDLYRDSPGGLDPHDMAVAQTLADVTAAYLLNAQAREEATVTSARFHHSATHDQLTGLPNRLLLQERLDHAAQRARRSHSIAAILFADLDRFKEVNDLHGHHGGDELLVAVARRLSGLVRSGDTLARFSGDEFVILFEDLHDASDAEKLATRINDAFTTPYIVAGLEVAITASIGVAYAGPGQQISEQLIVEADLAMYAAKRDGGASHQTVDARRAHLHDRPNSLERPMRSALAADELDVAYQPIVRSVDGVVTGVEALLRWTDRDRGTISPMTMVEVAEQSGLIDELGEWVLARACRDHQQWLRERPDLALDLAVNVSARQLSTAGFVSSVRNALRVSGTDPSSLILEMTESVFIDESERVSNALGDLDAAGIRLAIDDFGTGYSSMSYLGRLPVSIVKIDQCFIAHLGDDSGRKIVLAITNLAHDLGLTVVAEGVETISESNTIRAMGCDAAQGFVFARPMPASAISAHLARFARNNRKCASTARQWRLPDETAPFIDDSSSDSDLRPRLLTWSPHCTSAFPAHDGNALVGR